jgi:predicted nucleotidyltransferase component of viral defense system
MNWTTKEDLELIAKDKGYRPEILEKVYRLLDFIEEIMAIEYLKDRLVLKGGTAINVFCTHELPRLSVDLDFNYIGSSEREIMLNDKKEIDAIISALCQKKQYAIYRNPSAHAGGKMVLIYKSVLGRNGRLELDLNYLYRTPLWIPEWRYSADWLHNIGVRVLNIHELAAGKLHALLGRIASRDLFDSHKLLTSWPLEREKMRLAFTVYAGMRKNGWREMGKGIIQLDLNDIKNKLIPVLQQDFIPGTKLNVLKLWGEKLITESQTALQIVLPFNDQEISFLSALDHGNIRPELLSSNDTFCQAVVSHPALLWRVKQNG